MKTSGVIARYRRWIVVLVACISLAREGYCGPRDSASAKLEINSMLDDFEASYAESVEMTNKYRFIHMPAYNVDAAAKTKYDGLTRKRTELVRKMPRSLSADITTLLKKRRFDDATETCGRFRRVWITQVLPDIKFMAGGGAKGDQVVKEMDLSFMVKQQKRIMATYKAAKKGNEPLSSRYRVPVNMVYVPGGFFLMGRDGSGLGQNDFPMHVVYVDPFLVDRYEVRNSDYNRFVSSVRRSGDTKYAHPTAPPVKDYASEGSKNTLFSGANQPVVGVDWFDAYSYAKYARKRLLTEAEWEKAARGMYGRTYPWGSTPPTRMAVCSPSGRAFLASEMDRQCPPPPPKKGLFQKIGLEDAPAVQKTMLPDVTWSINQGMSAEAVALSEQKGFKLSKFSVSPYKIFHMAGNAAEWVSDWYDKEYYSVSPVKNPTGPERGEFHVFRGGSYLSADNELMTTWRGIANNKQLQDGTLPDGRPIIGIRCGKSLEMSLR